MATSQDWAYANNEPYLRPMRKARAAFEKFMNKSENEFWSAWGIHDNFAAFAKKQFSSARIKLELDKVTTMEKLIATLQLETANLKRMHAARKQE